MIDAPPSCYFCGSRLIAASLNFRKEVTGSDGGWRSMTDLLTVPVCETCLAWVETTARVAGSGKGHPRGLLGFPYAGSVKTLSDEHCNYCWAQLFSEAYAVDLIPTGRAAGPGGRQRHAGEMHAQRVCRYCYAWWRTTLRDPAAVNGTGFRLEEGEMGGWRTTVASDASSIALLERDDFTLSQTVGAIGRNFRKLALNDRAEVGAENNAVFFVCAGRRDRATAFVSRLDPRLRARVAVVGRADCMEDSVAALRLGAGELLASPLSPQQIVGFMERASRPPSPNPQRGKLLGLPILREPVARATLIPDHLIAVRPANGEDLPRAALMLRRFLRGYDEIGEDGAGGLLALVSCSAEDIGPVVDRLTHVFGEKSQVTHRASSPAAVRAAV